MMRNSPISSQNTYLEPVPNTRGGNDYTYNLGNGNKEIVLPDRSHNNTLILGAGITPEMLHFEVIRDGFLPQTKITIKGANPNNSLIINENLNSKFSGFNSLKNIEVGGVSLSMRDIHAALFQQQQPVFPKIPTETTNQATETLDSGDNTLTLNVHPVATDDAITFPQATNLATETLDNDDNILIFNKGDGHKFINFNEFNRFGGENTLVFGEGITEDMLTYYSKGENFNQYEIRINGGETGDRITISDISTQKIGPTLDYIEVEGILITVGDIPKTEKVAIKRENIKPESLYSLEITPVNPDAIASFGAENELQPTSCHCNPAITVRPLGHGIIAAA
ncbi:hypothetical protein [Yersinia alsatica]|uniref:hypothetical protein n=1 Tax=Yersinia alsatica TaxID=2890317 RepID=UPI00119E5A34|nr:hypothetical protein [Yersinia alsatica]